MRQQQTASLLSQDLSYSDDQIGLSSGERNIGFDFGRGRDLRSNSTKNPTPFLQLPTPALPSLPGFLLRCPFASL
jgi:hypothetical protein